MAMVPSAKRVTPEMLEGDFDACDARADAGIGGMAAIWAAVLVAPLVAAAAAPCAPGCAWEELGEAVEEEEPAA